MWSDIKPIVPSSLSFCGQPNATIARRASVAARMTATTPSSYGLSLRRLSVRLRKAVWLLTYYLTVSQGAGGTGPNATDQEGKRIGIQHPSARIIAAAPGPRTTLRTGWSQPPYNPQQRCTY